MTDTEQDPVTKVQATVMVADEAEVTARLAEDALQDVQKQLRALEARLMASVAKELAVIGELRLGHEKISTQLEHVYSIINVHNDHYAKMTVQMTELLSSNKSMGQYLATLEKLRQMLDISNESIKRN